MKQTCFDKKVPHAYIESGNFLVCSNCGKKRGPKKVRPYSHHPPEWAPWKEQENDQEATQAGLPPSVS